MNRKPVFDLVRKLLGRGFRQSEVQALDAALDLAGEPASKRHRALVPSEAAIRLIREFEGCARLRSDGFVEAYPDPGTGAAPWTIGWGATGPGIGPGTVWSRTECDARLASDVARHAQDVALAIGTAATTQSQFDAMTSFHFNTGAIERSTLLKRHISGDYESAAREFARWNRAGGRILKGLVRRRAAEERLYRSH